MADGRQPRQEANVSNYAQIGPTVSALGKGADFTHTVATHYAMAWSQPRKIVKEPVNNASLDRSRGRESLLQDS